MVTLWVLRADAGQLLFLGGVSTLNWAGISEFSLAAPWGGWSVESLAGAPISDQ